MDKAISNTSPLLYLYRIGGIDWLPRLFAEVCIPEEVVNELQVGKDKGYDVPHPGNYTWLRIVKPTSSPSQWLSADLGAGELSAIALALENPDRVVLLDDMLARRVAQSAGLRVWGTLRILLEAKSNGLISSITPYVSKLSRSGMWISTEIRQRILKLAGETG